MQQIIATVGRMIMHPKNISIKDYSYTLPEEKIARYPLPARDSSKILIYRDGHIQEDIYRNITTHIPSNSLLLFNDTKVVEARLLFKKATGGVIEVFCLEPHEEYADITSAMLEKQKVLWKCLVGGASKWKKGQVLEKNIEGGTLLQGRYIEKRSDHFIIELSWTPAHLSFAEVLHQAGVVPLPPYIKRESEAGDAERYQTIYAQYDGSVAAPTAGLHFTNAVFEDLKKKNVQTDFVTLHVGAGTFKPVKAETMEGHEMHAEFIDVSRSTVKNILEHINDPIIAVGTTSLRTIESLYWLGAKLTTGLLSHAEVELKTVVDQWDPYDNRLGLVPVRQSLETVLSWMEERQLEHLVARTQIIIAPGYKARIVKGLVTNFHQPNSTLLLLVAALIGDDWKKVYTYALENNYRFLSYGDGNLLWIQPLGL